VLLYSLTDVKLLLAPVFGLLLRALLLLPQLLHLLVALRLRVPLPLLLLLLEHAIVVKRAWRTVPCQLQ
jgi:hypothetical protein